MPLPKGSKNGDPGIIQKKGQKMFQISEDDKDLIWSGVIALILLLVSLAFV